MSAVRRAVAATALAWLGGVAACAPGAPRAADAASLRRADAPRSARVLLISFDGFRWDYVDRAPAVHLRALAARGVRAERMVPSFPSKTFPNHYTLVTGLTPEHHGIVANAMADPSLGRFRTSDTAAVRDPRWWGGEPIWVTAERQGRRAASYFWPGSEAPIQGIRPTWWEPYDHGRPHEDRVRRVLEWLAMPDSTAPAVITLYFAETDDAGHAWGPDDPRMDLGIARVDSVLGAIVAGIDRLGLTDVVNVLVVADHGMVRSSHEQLIAIDDYIDSTQAEIVDWTPVAAIQPRPGHEAEVYAALKDRHPHLQVYRREEVPARFRFRAHPRITPIVAIADEGWTITTRAARARRQAEGWVSGQHGYDPALPSMGAVFVGAGPGLARGRRVPAFGNVHVYPLMAHLLGVRPAASDGSLDSVRAFLR